MSVALELQGFSLLPKGHAFSTQIEAGARVAVVGPSGSGKSRFLRAVTGQDRPARGKARIAGGAVVADIEGTPLRATPQTICRRLAGPLGATPVAEALTATRLWECRQSSLSSLSDSRRAAAEILPLLLRPAALLVADGTLDRLDPWTLADVSAMLDHRLRMGATLLFATNNLEFATTADYVIVMHGLVPVFGGKVDDLVARAGPVLLEVETEERSRVRAVVDPVTVKVTETASGLTMEVPDGQAQAVELLLKGYGDVKLVTVHRPTLRQVVLERFGE